MVYGAAFAVCFLALLVGHSQVSQVIIWWEKCLTGNFELLFLQSATLFLIVLYCMYNWFSTMSKHFCKKWHNPSHKEWYKSNKEPKLVNMRRHGLGGVFTAFKLFSEGKGGKAHKVAMICTFCLKNCQRKREFSRFIPEAWVTMTLSFLT